MITTERLTLEDFTLDDAFEIEQWGKHTDERLIDYNLSDLDDFEIKMWYRQKREMKTQKYFAIRDKSRKLVGYVGLKQYDKFTKTAFLGIVLDPNEMDKSYGEESIKALITMGFTVYGLDRIFLNVNNFNKRAIKCYEKCGFRKFCSYEEVFENQRLDTHDEEFDEFFIVKDGTIFSKNTTMAIDNKR